MLLIHVCVLSEHRGVLAPCSQVFFCSNYIMKRAMHKHFHCFDNDSFTGRYWFGMMGSGSYNTYSEKGTVFYDKKGHKTKSRCKFNMYSESSKAVSKGTETNKYKYQKCGAKRCAYERYKQASYYSIYHPNKVFFLYGPDSTPRHLYPV